MFVFWIKGYKRDTSGHTTDVLKESQVLVQAQKRSIEESAADLIEAKRQNLEMQGKLAKQHAYVQELEQNGQSSQIHVPLPCDSQVLVDNPLMV